MFLNIMILRPITEMDAILIIRLLIQSHPALLERIKYMINYPAKTWQIDQSFDFFQEYHQRFRDSFNFEALAQRVNPAQPASPSQNALPSYFGTICHRTLPILDQYFHRVFEMEIDQSGGPAVIDSFNAVLAHCSILYKFHPKPITYLYQTLYNYSLLSAAIKRTFTRSILEHLKCESYSHLSQTYINIKDEQFPQWCPDVNYYLGLIYNLVRVIDGVGQEPEFDPIGFDWRFHEFTNPVHLTLYSMCIELMTLAVPPPDVGRYLFEIVTNPQSPVESKSLPKCFNAVGLLLSHLPVSYSEIINQTILKTLSHEQLLIELDYSSGFPFHIFTFSIHQNEPSSPIGRIITSVHAIWSHMGIAKLTQMSALLRDLVRPQVKTELQLLFICHLIGPFFARLEKERTRVLTDVVIQLYQIILQVSQITNIVHADTIADMLYHIKYKHVGELIKQEIQQIIIHLPPNLKEKLKFLIRTRQTSSSVTINDQNMTHVDLVDQN
jgi:mediator of RNA polymerase II transcription subunit 23